VIDVSLEVNGHWYQATVEPRLLLSDLLRHELGLTATHVGCEHGVCGACTVQLDGVPVRSCLLFGVQAEGCSVRTAEGLDDGLEDGAMHPLKQAFHEAHALQCGFCTAGLLMTLDALLPELAERSDPEIREALAGNLCRCTGYANIVKAVRLASERIARSE
jgi:carbon-monoxide dehydrogenase small subunit